MVSARVHTFHTCCPAFPPRALPPAFFRLTKVACFSAEIPSSITELRYLSSLNMFYSNLGVRVEAGNVADLGLTHATVILPFSYWNLRHTQIFF